MEAAHVYKAIVAVTAQMAKEGISKSHSNKAQGYNFRSVDDVYAALGGLLAQHNLCMLPRVTERASAERPTAKGGVATYTTLTVEFDLVSAVDGSKHTICTVGEAMDTADKSSNKSMSAAFKYAAFLAFQIPTEGDNDADAHHIEKAPAPAPQKPSEAETAIAALFMNARTTDDVSAAEAAAARAISEKRVVNGGRDRLLRLRADAISRLEGR